MQKSNDLINKYKSKAHNTSGTPKNTK